MIYGPYSTGWRTGGRRRLARARARGALLGAALTLGAGLVFWRAVAWLF
jgi:hypothetical protein